MTDHLDPNLRLPGCTGECQQGRRPCLHAEQCWPDEPFVIRHPYLTGFGAFVLIFLLVQLVVVLAAWLS